jgi:hypothetical protein
VKGKQPEQSLRSQQIEIADADEVQNFPVRAADDAGDVIGPSRERSSHLAGIGAAIVDTGDTGLVATDVVQHSFNDL